MSSSRSLPWPGLTVLSVAIFFCITSEVLPTGLMPEIVEEFGVTEAQVGLLVTIFAASVALSAAPLAALTHRYSRKSLVVVVLVVFALANLLAAIAPVYGVLVVARVLGGLAHGLFWAVVGAYAGHLVAPAQLGRAVALVNAGGTLAFVLGVPIGTALGHAFGWRWAFGAIAAIVVIIIVLVIVLLPAVDHRVPVATGEIAVPVRKDRTIPAVAVVCVTVLLVMFAQYVFYSFITPFLLGPGGIDRDAVAGVLFLYGAAAAVGLVLSGFVAERMPRYGYVVFLAFVVLGVVGVGLFPSNTVALMASIAFWSIAFGGFPAMMQTRMLHAASPRIRDLASAFLTTSFNIAIGGGAAVGGLLLTGYGVGVLPFATAVLGVVAIAFGLTADAALRRRRPQVPVEV